MSRCRFKSIFKKLKKAFIPFSCITKPFYCKNVPRSEFSANVFKEGEKYIYELRNCLIPLRRLTETTWQVGKKNVSPTLSQDLNQKSLRILIFLSKENDAESVSWNLPRTNKRLVNLGLINFLIFYLFC